MSVRRILACALWLSIDHFWLLLRCNLLSLLLALPILTFPLGLAGNLRVGERLLASGEASLRDYFLGIKKLSGRVYLGTVALVLLWAWCLLSWKFYSVQSPLLASMGCTITALVAAGCTTLGYLALPAIAQKKSWIEALVASARLVLQRPMDILRFLLSLLATEGLLILTGAGFLAVGLLWPILGSLFLWADYRHVHFGDPPHDESRSFKDFFLPTKLIP